MAPDHPAPGSARNAQNSAGEREARGGEVRPHHPWRMREERSIRVETRTQAKNTGAGRCLVQR